MSAETEILHAKLKLCRDIGAKRHAEVLELRSRVAELEEKYSYVVSENVKLCNENAELVATRNGRPES